MGDSTFVDIDERLTAAAGIEMSRVLGMSYQEFSDEFKKWGYRNPDNSGLEFSITQEDLRGQYRKIGLNGMLKYMNLSTTGSAKFGIDLLGQTGGRAGRVAGYAGMGLGMITLGRLASSLGTTYQFTYDCGSLICNINGIGPLD